MCHSLPMGRDVLARLLALSGLNTAQAELLVTVLRECCFSSAQLAADVLEAVTDTPGWGSLWNETTVAAMSQIISLKPSLSQDHIQRHASALCAAASLPHLQTSVKFAKLLISFVTAYAAQCRPQKHDLLQAAGKGKSFLAKTCTQKVQKLLVI